MDIEFGLGIVVGVVATLFLSYFRSMRAYKKNEREKLILKKGVEVIKSYNDIQERNMRFYEANERDLLRHLQTAVEGLMEAGDAVHAQALRTNTNRWVTERNMNGVNMNSEFVRHAEKFLAFKNLVKEDAQEELADLLTVSGEIYEHPKLRLIKNSPDEPEK